MFCHSNTLTNSIHEDHSFLYGALCEGSGGEQEIQFTRAFSVDLRDGVGNVRTIQGPFA